jgi:DNA topoisomerase VI subunit A
MFTTCIVVVESESFYHQLVQYEFWLNFNCILVTGKGIPEVATQACVYALHKGLHLPVHGLVDYNPYVIQSTSK